ncbi:unnamed protein product [Sphagnum troendelagicum]|uniref:Uncharacterized protein n=1 Tax=Sphagnum troendelagicum TaxID=128251 RepID=A0ABP0V2T5_9BRYO
MQMMMIQLHTRVPPSQLGDLVTSVVCPAIKANWASTLGLRNLGTVFVEDLEFYYISSRSWMCILAGWRTQ